MLEVGCGWIGSFLDRMDAVYDTISAKGLPLSMPPSEYFRRQCFISGDPDETAAPHIIDQVGADCFMWATDYPHPDCTWPESQSVIHEHFDDVDPAHHLVVAKASDLTALDVTVEEGVKLVISGGLLTPTRLLADDQSKPSIDSGDT